MGTHDLAGEGEADAGAFGVGGEEGVEDVVGVRIGNGVAVIGDVDLGVVGSVDEGSDTDEGHVVEGSGSRSGLLPEPVAESIERILQDVRNHLPHQLLVGEEDHILILQGNIDPSSELLHPGQQRREHIVQHRPELEGMNLRHRHTGEGAVAVDEAKEAAGRLAERLWA